jgi:hypothetical protein
MKKFKKIGFMVLSMAFVSQAMAGTVTLQQNYDDGAAGAEFRLGVVAKVQGQIEVDLINSGLTTELTEEGQKKLQAYAFGQKDAASVLSPAAEKFFIDGSVDAATQLEDEVCDSAEPEHIKRLVSYVATNVTPAEAARCDLSDIGNTNKIDARFHVDYAVRASGGLQAQLTVDAVENGLDIDYIAANAAKQFMAASVEELSLTPLDVNAGVLVGDGSILDEGDEGTLQYELSFDVSGANSKEESRMVFAHVLQIQ